MDQTQYVDSANNQLSDCTIVTPLEWKERHDKMGYYIHWKIC